MKGLLSALIVGGLFVWLPGAADAQQTGFSIEMPGRPPGIGQPVEVRPVTPPLPLALPSIFLPSLALKLQPLNLVSNGLAPPRLNLFASSIGSRGLLFPALPFPLDPIAAGITPPHQLFPRPEICIDPAVQADPVYRRRPALY